MVRFARLASEAGRGPTILPLLATALAEHVGAAAVAVLEIHENGTVFTTKGDDGSGLGLPMVYACSGMAAP